MTYRTAGLGIGACLVILAFIILLVSVCTNFWVEIQVDRNVLGVDSSSAGTLGAFTRNRGLFTECYRDRTATKEYVVKNVFADETKECLRNELSFTRDVVYNPQYKTRIALHICTITFLVLALLLCICALVVFGYSVYVNENENINKWTLATKWAGILVFLAAFCNALAMAFFHGADYMETNLIVAQPPEAIYSFYFTKSQPAVLQNATLRSYSWSYALSWLAVFFEVMGAITLFLCGTCCGPSKKSDRGWMVDANTLNSTKSFGQRNLAYEYMEGKQPVAIYEAQQPHMISDGAYHDHFQGRHFDPYSRGPVRQEAKQHYNYDEGGWNWQ